MAHAVLCRDADDAKIPPRNYFFHRQADSHYASNLNHKVYTVMRIEYKKKPAYLLGHAYEPTTQPPTQGRTYARTVRAKMPWKKNCLREVGLRAAIRLVTVYSCSYFRHLNSSCIGNAVYFDPSIPHHPSHTLPY
jgi:hypothetical protein